VAVTATRHQMPRRGKHTTDNPSLKPSALNP